MPFCESGLVPDIIFNPHGYPSRMTIGMMLESMAGKSVSMNGKPEDASPFSSAFDESRPAHEYHGDLLRQAGLYFFMRECTIARSAGVDFSIRYTETFIKYGGRFYLALKSVGNS